MFLPTFDFEKKLWQQGFKLIVGLDEAGRGPLAGPVVAGAVVFDFDSVPPFIKGGLGGIFELEFEKTKKSLPRYAPQLRGFGEASPTSLSKGRSEIKDSKHLSASQRERWYKILTSSKNVKWGIGVVSQKIIDEINILKATKLAMKRALENLEIEPDYLLLDGNFTLDDLAVNQKAVISGDEKIISVAAASIFAKVTRDRLMQKYHQKFPIYGFAQHKGYGTKNHLAALRRHGPCPLHRFSFKPVKKLVNK